MAVTMGGRAAIGWGIACVALGMSTISRGGSERVNDS
jgi:hypothetical protein